MYKDVIYLKNSDLRQKILVLTKRQTCEVSLQNNM